MLKAFLLTLTLISSVAVFAQSRGTPDREIESGASKAEECTDGRCAKNEDTYFRHLSRAETIELVRRIWNEDKGTEPPELPTARTKGTR